jgi:hypothetical protein
MRRQNPRFCTLSVNSGTPTIGSTKKIDFSNIYRLERFSGVLGLEVVDLEENVYTLEYHEYRNPSEIRVSHRP